MDNIINVFIVVLLGIFIWIRFAPVKGVNLITPQQLRAKLKQKNNKRQLIDVRTNAEYNTNHINGFKNIPLQQIAQMANHLNKNEEVVLICRSGSRSRTASKILAKQGFQFIYDVKGGMNQWQ